MQQNKDLFFFVDSTLEGVTDKPILDCCACGTAKYRLTFYGNWSEKSHPKDYPREYFSYYILFHCCLLDSLQFLWFKPDNVQFKIIF